MRYHLLISGFDGRLAAAGHIGDVFDGGGLALRHRHVNRSCWHTAWLSTEHQFQLIYSFSDVDGCRFYFVGNIQSGSESWNEILRFGHGHCRRLHYSDDLLEHSSDFYVAAVADTGQLFERSAATWFLFASDMETGADSGISLEGDATFHCRIFHGFFHIFRSSVHNVAGQVNAISCFSELEGSLWQRIDIFFWFLLAAHQQPRRWYQ